MCAGCFGSPPYLDDYGETDQGLKRGNPLHLESGQYAKLCSTWLSHALPDAIAHTMESSSLAMHANALLPTEWQHL